MLIGWMFCTRPVGNKLALPETCKNRNKEQEKKRSGFHFINKVLDKNVGVIAQK